MTVKSPWVTVFTVQGIVAPVIYFSATFFGGLFHPDYNHFSQAISELSAAGEVNQSWLLAAFAIVELLTILFGIGYYLVVRDDNNALHASALIVILIGFVGLGFARYPMDRVGTPATFDGQVHIFIVTISALFAITAVILSGFGWKLVSDGSGMSRFCIAMLFVMLLSGLISLIVVKNGLPGVGIWQRINVGAFSLWEAGTAFYLLHRMRS